MPPKKNDARQAKPTKTPAASAKKSDKNDLKIMNMRRLFGGAGAFIAVSGLMATAVFLQVIPWWLGATASVVIRPAWTMAVTAVVLTEGALYVFYRAYRAQDERHQVQIREYADRLEKVVVQRTLSLQESQEDYRRLLEIAPDGIVLHSGSKIVFVNDAAARMYGAPAPAALVGKPIFDIIDKQHHGMVTVRIGMLAKGIGVPPMIEKMRRMDGSTFDAEVNSVPYDRGGVPSALSFIRDISKRRRTEDELRMTSDMLGSIVREARLALIANDHEGKVTLWNPSAERMFGWTEAETVGKPNPTIPDGDSAEFDRMRQHIAEGRTVERAKVRRVTKSGAVIEPTMWASPVRDAKGKAVGSMTMYIA